MNATERRLSETARSLALTKALEVGQIEQEIEDLKSQILVLQAKADLGRAAMDKFERYTPQIEDVYQCPWCWIEFERRQRLDVTGRKFDRHDAFGDDTLNCIYCGNDWPVPRAPLRPAGESGGA